MQKRFFIAGTDTEVGKTYVTCELIRLFKNQNYCTIATKPIASGSVETKNGLRNEDALMLQSLNSMVMNYELVNPFSFLLPISPHIAANKTDKILSVNMLKEYYKKIFLLSHDISLIEGVGGWFVPLSYKETMADFVKALDLQVILVVGMRLGCLNHAVLTARAIKAMGVRLYGWIANSSSLEMLNYKENVETLKHMLDSPLLGEVKFGKKLSISNENYNMLYNI